MAGLNIGAGGSPSTCEKPPLELFHNIFLRNIENSYFIVHLLQNARITKCTCCKVHMLQSAHVTNFPCCKVHVLQSAHVAKCTNFKVHMLQSARVAKCKK